MLFGNTEEKILHNKVMGKGGKIKTESNPLSEDSQFSLRAHRSSPDPSGLRARGWVSRLPAALPPQCRGLENLPGLSLMVGTSDVSKYLIFGGKCTNTLFPSAFEKDKWMKGCNYRETAELTLPRDAPPGGPNSRDHTQPHDAILLKQNMAGKVTSQQPPRAGLLSESPLVVLETRIHLFSWLSLQSTGLGSRAAVTQLLQP
ncbi:hypothetical protein EK904_009605 [Melospiza melodia maxima]|nr:hypothetical protein EK904_009605 [Melospiza melodia maxima]